MTAVLATIRRVILGTGSTAFTIVGALLIGFGVPLFWIFLASQFYAKTGAVNGPVTANGGPAGTVAPPPTAPPSDDPYPTQPLPGLPLLLDDDPADPEAETLPARGEAFCHGYLSHCIGPEAVDYRGAFLAHLARSRTHAYPYVFVGLSPEEARRRPASWLGVTLSSTTYAYGNAPSALAVGFHELTLI